MDNQTEVELFSEILPSDQLGAYQNWSYAITNIVGSTDPSILWEQIKWNPWLAMAVYEDLSDKDSTLFSCLEKRKDGVLALPRSVKPFSDSSQDIKIAEFVEETLEQYFGGNNMTLGADSHEASFESFLSEALDAVGDGVTIGEIIFAEAKDRIYISEVKFKPQHLFAFGETGLAAYSTDLNLYPQTGRLKLRSGIIIGDKSPLEMELPENKFFVFSYRPRFGNRWGSPLKRKVFWQTWIKRAAAKGWLRYIEKGSGTVVARYNDGAAKEEQQNAVDAATAVQEDSAVAIPKKFFLEVHEMVRAIGSSHKELVDDYCNAEISRAIVGQTLTGRGSDGGGSRALGEVHERVEAIKIENDAKALMAVVNRRIVRPLVMYNFGPKAMLPTWTLDYEQSEDLNAMAERYGKLRQTVGLPLSKKHLYETFQTPEPEGEDDSLGGEMMADKKEDPLDAKTLEFAEKKNFSFRQQIELEDGTLQAIAPVYDAIFGRVISSIADSGLGIADFDNLLSSDFQRIDNLLSDGIFAAYLLGFDTTSAENKAKIEAANFAEGDDDKLVESIGDDALQLRFDVPPKEAIDYFKRKRVMTKKEFNKLEREAKAAAFTVGEIYKEDLLEAFKDEISSALETGQSQKFVIDKFKNILDGAGHKMLGDYHLESIFRTNMQMAYGVGRRKAMEDSAKDLPFWEYSTVGDDRVRPTHQALDGITFPANHPFWNDHYPPWGFACRCNVFAVFNYRENYIHDRPNPDTTIAFDADGIPAKAEYLTQVVDLKATKFVGVPKSANLEKALKDNAKRAKENRKKKN